MNIVFCLLWLHQPVILDEVMRFETQEVGLVRPTTGLIWRDQLVVLDPGDHCLHLWDQEGKYIKRLGQKGEGPGEFLRPSAICVRNGELIVLDKRKMLHYFDHQGKFVKQRPLPAFFRIVRDFSGWHQSFVLNYTAQLSSNKEQQYVSVLDEHYQIKYQLKSQLDEFFVPDKNEGRVHNPWRPRLLFATFGEDILVASTAMGEILRHTLTGELKSTIKVPLEAPEPSADSITYFKKRFKRWAKPNDRMIVPEKDGVIDYLFANQPRNQILALQMLAKDGRYQGFMFNGEGQILGKLSLHLGDQGRIFVSEGKTVFIGTDEQGEFYIAEKQLR